MLTSWVRFKKIEKKMTYGHWVYEGNVYVAKCSVCGNYLDMRGVGSKANFCPHCGAKMEGVEEE